MTTGSTPPPHDGHAGDGHNGTGAGPRQDLARASEDPLADPGLPHHTPRRTDTDPRAAARAERQVAGLFGLSALATVVFIACYIGIDPDETITVVGLGKLRTLNFALGVSLGVALLGIGTGAIHWARKLMAGEEMVEYRHEQKSSPQVTAEALERLQAGAADSAIPRRKLLWTSMLGAMAIFPLAPLFTLGSLGPGPGRKLRSTIWADPKHRQIVQANSGERIRPEDLQIGSLISVEPQDIEEQSELAKAAVMLIRLRPQDIRSPEQREASYEGICAYSKICVHAGCPLGLFEETTKHMLCPCHQSTFNLANGGEVIFGPAARDLPLLPITVDGEGFLVARGDFPVPVGPSFWERGGDE